MGVGGADQVGAANGDFDASQGPAFVVVDGSGEAGGAVLSGFGSDEEGSVAQEVGGGVWVGGVGFKGLGFDADEACGGADEGAHGGHAVFVGGDDQALGGFARVCAVGVCAGGGTRQVGKAGVAFFDGENDGDVGQ